MSDLGVTRIVRDRIDLVQNEAHAIRRSAGAVVIVPIAVAGAVVRATTEIVVQQRPRGRTRRGE
ncbi:MAG TPA: hypothetical protein EYQ64_06730 [Gemmatimonadetes bacterium]|nr:hypothetical protein [Gemmatimonadota bacterium]